MQKNAKMMQKRTIFPKYGACLTSCYGIFVYLCTKIAKNREQLNR